MTKPFQSSTSFPALADSVSPPKSPTLWPTPSSNKITESGEIVMKEGTVKPHSKITGKPIQTALSDAVKLWPTARAARGHNQSVNPVAAAAALARGEEIGLGYTIALLGPSPTAKLSHLPAPSIIGTFPIRSALVESRMLQRLRCLSDAVSCRLSSVAAFLASRIPAPESEKQALTNATFGMNAGECFGSYDRDSRCSRTSAGCLQASKDFFTTAYCQTWPRFGLLVSGRLYPLPMLALPTDANGSGSSASTNWPTARREDGESCGNHPGVTDSLTGAVKKTWPTPDASVAQDGESLETWEARRKILKAKHNNGNGCGTPLTMAVQQWPTPTKQDGENNAGPSQLDRNSLPLNTLVTLLDGQPLTDSGQADPVKPNSDGNQKGLWPTPTAEEAEHSGRKTNSGHQEHLAVKASERWRTPSDPTNRGGSQDAEKRKEGGHTINLEDQVHTQGKLNPQFVWILMGYPPLWAEIGLKFTTASRNSKRPATPS